MKIDTYYFSHDSNAMDDPKIVSLIDSLGMEGYGIFWGLIEVLRNQPNLRYPVNSAVLKYRQWNTSADKIKVVISKYDLFTIEDDLFFSLSLNRRMKEADKRRLKYVESGRLGGLKKAENQLDSSNAKASLKRKLPIKVKESKVNESKVNEIKGNENPAYAEVIPYPSFDDFWNAYEKKVDRAKCEKKWGRLSQKEKEAALEYLPAYKSATPDIKFRRNPETFINNKTWENEIINHKNGNGAIATDWDKVAREGKDFLRKQGLI